MTLSKAVEGFLLYMASGSYATATTHLYRFILSRLVKFLDNPQVDHITAEKLQAFLLSTKSYSGSYQDNHWKCLKTFFGWASKTLNFPRPDANLPRPKFKTPQIQPFSQDDIRKLLAACDYTPEFSRVNTRPYKIRRPTRLRDRVVILVLLDTGLRIGELCRLKIRDINLDTGEVVVTPYSTGRKTRPRIVFIGAAARRATWLYLAHLKYYHQESKLINENPDAIRKVLKQLGSNAGVPDTHPHRFRHTFAIQYLRNHGDVFTLQRLLGHESLDMVRKYLAIADIDSASAHRRASPVDNWKL